MCFHSQWAIHSQKWHHQTRDMLYINQKFGHKLGLSRNQLTIVLGLSADCH